MDTYTKEFKIGKRLDILYAIFFMMSNSFLHKAGQFKMVGIPLVFIVSLTFLIKKKNIYYLIKNAPVELWLYTIWFLWAFFTGYFWAEDLRLFRMVINSTLYLVIFVWILYFLAMDTRNVDWIFAAFVLTAFLQLVWIILETNNWRFLFDSYHRYRGSFLNPNGLGFLTVYAIGVMLSYFRPTNKFFKNFIILLIVLLFFLLLTATGSRKSFIAVMVLLAVWFIFIVPRHFSISLSKQLFMLLLYSFIFWVSYRFIVPNFGETSLGHRFLRLYQGDVGYNLEHVGGRFYMYKLGLELFFKSPIVGVGLNNFAFYHYEGKYSHSDLIEILADNGVIGFILYEAIYIIIFLKLLYLIRSPQYKSNSEIKYKAELFLSLVLSILIIGFGAPLYKSFYSRVLLTSIILYVHLLKSTQANHELAKVA